MLGSSSAELVALLVEANVVNLILVSLNSANLSRGGVGFENVDPVVIAEINAGNEGGIVVESDSIDTS